ncbi:acyl-homoserine-lactone synthase [Agrobacterium vitis]|uniref:Acyl-homoserine-lactone synthase n=1 Tax=Agrobacterium vitis TaxID=373 RepID=A0A7K1RFR7_AGRVI|nr:acyl-homoserine-lactone synthase [Agrobacterium vitis]MVA56852.1 GNAT family N-acetyltransferase [Agrobacterium vitis]
MMNLIDSSNRTMHSETLRSFAELRHEVFVRRLGWALSAAREGLEEDKYDTSRAVYVTISNSTGHVVAGARLLDTSNASLLHEIFPHLVKDGNPQRSDRIYEVTRFVIDHRRERLEGCMDLRNRLLWGIQAAALHLKLEKMVSVTYTHLEPMLQKAGYRFRRLGDVHCIDGIPTVALEHEVSLDILDACCSSLRTGRAYHKSKPLCHSGSQSDQSAASLVHPAFSQLSTSNYLVFQH